MDIGITAFDYPELLSSRLTIRGAQQKAHSSLQRECGLYSNPRGQSIAHIDRGASGCGERFDCFLFGLVLLAFGGCSPQNLAAAKGEQVGKHMTLFPFSVFSVVKFSCAPRPRK